jgi:hypothetical protein
LISTSVYAGRGTVCAALGEDFPVAEAVEADTAAAVAAVAAAVAAARALCCTLRRRGSRITADGADGASGTDTAFAACCAKGLLLADVTASVRVGDRVGREADTSPKEAEEVAGAFVEEHVWERGREEFDLGSDEGVSEERGRGIETEAVLLSERVNVKGDGSLLLPSLFLPGTGAGTLPPGLLSLPLPLPLASTYLSFERRERCS